jgi:hypothetical protein
MEDLSGLVVGVVGGNGGVGASTFAALLAAAEPRSVLVDLDGAGGGIDVLLGIESVPGARWSQLRIGGGRLAGEVLTEGLPRWGAVPVLAADSGAPPAAALGTVLTAASEAGPAVLNLPRGAQPARERVVRRCRLIVVVAWGSVTGLAAARAVVRELSGARCGLVVHRGPVREADAAGLVGAPLLGVLPRPGPPRETPLDPDRLPPRSARVAAGVWDGIRRDEPPARHSKEAR